MRSLSLLEPSGWTPEADAGGRASLGELWAKWAASGSPTWDELMVDGRGAGVAGGEGAPCLAGACGLAGASGLAFTGRGETDASGPAALGAGCRVSGSTGVGMGVESAASFWDDGLDEPVGSAVVFASDRSSVSWLLAGRGKWSGFTPLARQRAQIWRSPSLHPRLPDSTTASQTEHITLPLPL